MKLVMMFARVIGGFIALAMVLGAIWFIGSTNRLETVVAILLACLLGASALIGESLLRRSRGLAIILFCGLICLGGLSSYIGLTHFGWFASDTDRLVIVVREICLFFIIALVAFRVLKEGILEGDVRKHSTGRDRG
jgi:hypothetical protein